MPGTTTTFEPPKKTTRKSAPKKNKPAFWIDRKAAKILLERNASAPVIYAYLLLCCHSKQKDETRKSAVSYKAMARYVGLNKIFADKVFSKLQELGLITPCAPEPTDNAIRLRQAETKWQLTEYPHNKKVHSIIFIDRGLVHGPVEPKRDERPYKVFARLKERDITVRVLLALLERFSLQSGAARSCQGIYYEYEVTEILLRNHYAVYNAKAPRELTITNEFLSKLFPAADVDPTKKKAVLEAIQFLERRGIIYRTIVSTLNQPNYSHNEEIATMLKSFIQNASRDEDIGLDEPDITILGQLDSKAETDRGQSVANYINEQLKQINIAPPRNDVRSYDTYRLVLNEEFGVPYVLGLYDISWRCRSNHLNHLYKANDYYQKRIEALKSHTDDIVVGKSGKLVKPETNKIDSFMPF